MLGPLESVGVNHVAPPSTYYDMLEERLPGHGEPTEELDAWYPPRRNHCRQPPKTTSSNLL